MIRMCPHCLPAGLDSTSPRSERGDPGRNKSVKKRTETLTKREARAQESGKNVAGIHRLLSGVVQLTTQFIRTIRHGIVARMRWLAALDLFRASMKSYL